MRKSIALLIAITAITVLMIVRCTTPIVAGSTTVIPQPFPGSEVTGINFPTDSTTILGWTNDAVLPTRYDSINIYKHAWGIWAGLTAPTNQSVGGDSLTVFETWMGINEIRQYIKDDSSNCQPGITSKRGRAPLTRPTQFEHAGILARSINMRALSAAATSSNFAVANNLWVTVSYDPNMACHAINNKLLRMSTINSYYQANGYGTIKPFPNNAIFIKPTYLEYPSTAKVLQMPVWINPPNPPDSLNVFDPNQFPLCVYVDVNNGQENNKKLTPVTPSCTNKDSIANATCNINDFIHFNVDSTMATFMNEQDKIQGLSGKNKAQAGNIVLLVAMHVGTKEISNWTWQTFYWTPMPATPGGPSSNLAASLLPPTVKGAARHYAANAAYVMTTPNNSSAANAGSMFGYDPYLEGGFGPTTFNIPNNWQPAYKYGMQTNCMACHALAVPSQATGYTTDQYISLNDNLFKGQVRLDFAWSIQTALIKDTIPYWEFKK